MSIYSFNTDLFNKQFLPPTKRKESNYAWGRVLLSGVQWLRDLFFDDYVQGNTDTRVQNYFVSTAYVVGDLVYYETTGLIYVCILGASIGNAPTNASFFTIKTFAVGDRIRFADKSVYECILANTTGVSPINTTYWIKIQDSFIGLIERTKTNSQILLFEYLLNKWFDTSYNYPSVNDIYITNNEVDTNSFVFGVDESESSVVEVDDLAQESFINSSFLFEADEFTINIPYLVYDALIPSEAPVITTLKDNVVKSFADKYVCAGMTYNINRY